MVRCEICQAELVDPVFIVSDEKNLVDYEVCGAACLEALARELLTRQPE